MATTHKRFKMGAKVSVAQCYLDDEVSQPNRSEMSETATVCSEPTDDEELVSIQYESGLIDFVPQDILEVIDTLFDEAKSRYGLTLKKLG